MTPHPSSNLSPAAAGAPVANFVEIFPPRTVEITIARQLAAFIDPCAPAAWLAGKLAREPRQQDSFLLVALVDGVATGWIKLQHGRKARGETPGECWIRELEVDVQQRRRGIGRELVRRAWSLVFPHEQLVVEVPEHRTGDQLFLAAAGLTCRPPWERSMRQRSKRLYEFRDIRPVARPFAGQARFTWPLV